MDGQEDHFRSASRFSEPGRGFDSAQNRHGNVEQKKIGIQADSSLNRAFSVLDGTNDIKPTVEQL